MQGNTLPFQNTYIDLPENFYAKASADEVPNPSLIAYNQDLGEELGIDLSQKSDSELAQLFSGNITPEGASPKLMPRIS